MSYVLREKIEEYVEEGYSYEEAVELAEQRIGDILFECYLEDCYYEGD